MPVFDLFSYRKCGAEGETPDVFVYIGYDFEEEVENDELPEALRVQIIHIWRDSIGKFHVYIGYDFEEEVENNMGWQFIHDAVARERQAVAETEPAGRSIKPI